MSEKYDDEKKSSFMSMANELIKEHPDKLKNADANVVALTLEGTTRTARSAVDDGYDLAKESEVKRYNQAHSKPLNPAEVVLYNMLAKNNNLTPEQKDMALNLVANVIEKYNMISRDSGEKPEECGEVEWKGKVVHKTEIGLDAPAPQPLEVAKSRLESHLQSSGLPPKIEPVKIEPTNTTSWRKTTNKSPRDI